MSYTPTTWQSTDIVTATRMNALEQAVGDLNMSYTPNVWQNGDILTADKMNALEQAVASGGGGGGDLSEANVTFVNNSATYLPCGCFYVYDWGDELGVMSDTGLFSSDTYIVPLYQGLAIWNFGDDFPFNRVTTSGDVAIDSEEFVIYITGDCTITLT